MNMQSVYEPHKSKTSQSFKLVWTCLKIQNKSKTSLNLAYFKLV